VRDALRGALREIREDLCARGRPHELRSQPRQLGTAVGRKILRELGERERGDEVAL
jgi:hypothetical protein